MVLWSRDLSAFYRSLVRGEPCRLDELEAQSLGYAAWQRGFEAGPAAAAQLAWWRGYLAGLFEEEIADPMSMIPTRRPPSRPRRCRTR